MNVRLILVLIAGLLSLVGCSKKQILIPFGVDFVYTLENTPAPSGNLLLGKRSHHNYETQSSLCIPIPGSSWNMPVSRIPKVYVGELVSFLQGDTDVKLLYVQGICLQATYSKPSGFSDGEVQQLEKAAGLEDAVWTQQVFGRQTNWVDTVSGTKKFWDDTGSLVLRAKQYGQLKAVSRTTFLATHVGYRGK
jgi:hypothetical protein